MKQFYRHFSALIAETRGSVLILGAGAIIMLVALVGGAVDMARYINVNSKFKDAADSALLSAVTVHETQDVDEVARKFFMANFPPEYLKSIILSDIDVTSDPVNGEWTAVVDGEIKMQFAQFVGFDSIKVGHKVTVAWDVDSRMEIVFTVDTSASMCQTIEHGATREDGSYILKVFPDESCKKLNAMKEALGYVIDNGLGGSGSAGPEFSVGIVPFNHKVKFPNLAAVPSIMSGIEISHAKGYDNYYTDFGDAEPLSPITPLIDVRSDDDRNELRTRLSAITQHPLGSGWNRSNIGVQAAALMLDPEHYNAFQGDQPTPFGESDKVVVMMTSGANIGCCYSQHPAGNYENQYLYLYQSDNAHLSGLAKADPAMRNWAQAYGIQETGLCDAMKARGITVYSVVFDVDDNDPGGAEIKKTYKDCASSEQYFFDVMSDEDLKLAYKTITQSILKLRIIY